MRIANQDCRPGTPEVTTSAGTGVTISRRRRRTALATLSGCGLALLFGLAPPVAAGISDGSTQKVIDPAGNRDLDCQISKECVGPDAACRGFPARVGITLLPTGLARISELDEDGAEFGHDFGRRILGPSGDGLTLIFAHAEASVNMLTVSAQGNYLETSHYPSGDVEHANYHGTCEGPLLEKWQNAPEKETR